MLKAIGNAGVKGLAGLAPPISGLISKGGGKAVSLGVDAGKDWVLDYLAGDTKKKLGIETIKNRERSFTDLQKQININLKNAGFKPIDLRNIRGQLSGDYKIAFELGNKKPWYKKEEDDK